MQIRNPDVTKQNILMAAEGEFASYGLFGARVNAIAERAKANKRMIYHYYGSKEGLYETVLEYNFKKVVQLGSPILLTEGDLEEAIRNIIRRYYIFLEENPNFVKIIAWEEVYSSSQRNKIVFGTLKNAFRQVTEFYKRGCKQGIFTRDVNLPQLLISTHAMCLTSFTQQEILLKIDPTNTLEKRLSHICEVVIRAIAEPSLNYC